ncbi:MAG: HTTM domain-containing protein [Bacteroidota bacterium]
MERSLTYRLLKQPKDIAALASFRILFGGLMCFGALRFMWEGWIEKLYVAPRFFFKFYGFEWVEPLGESGMYLVYLLIALSAAGIMLGFLYRISATVFFISFTYVELLDATNYLNHYYLVCLLAFYLIFLPAHQAFSLDVRRKAVPSRREVPAWCIHLIMLQLGLVYFYAGVAKLNADWLFRAMPMAAWLPEHTDLPLLGYFFQFWETAFIFSWVGACYDLTVAFFLLWNRTRIWAYLVVVAFHLMTHLLFNIGLFPFIMIFSTLIFFPGNMHRIVLEKLFGSQGQTKTKDSSRIVVRESALPSLLRPVLQYGIAFLLLFQFLFPLRHFLYQSDVMWSEEGYRFSWRVMLVEKHGLATFTIEDPATGRKNEIINNTYLTTFQEKQMSIQPDFMLQYAHFLAREYEQKHGFHNPIVKVDAHVALNGRSSRRFIDPDINLNGIQDDFLPKKWILAAN